MGLLSFEDGDLMSHFDKSDETQNGNKVSPSNKLFVNKHAERVDRGKIEGY